MRVFLSAVLAVCLCGLTTAREDKMEAEYKVAQERCDSLSGDAKEACVKEAKARYHQ